MPLPQLHSAQHLPVTTDKIPGAKEVSSFPRNKTLSLNVTVPAHVLLPSQYISGCPLAMTFGLQFIWKKPTMYRPTLFIEYKISSNNMRILLLIDTLLQFNSIK